MIRRKLQLDEKVLSTSLASLGFYLAVAIAFPKWPPNGPVVSLMVGAAIIASLYGIFGTFFAGMSVWCRHSHRIKEFWEGACVSDKCKTCHP